MLSLHEIETRFAQALFKPGGDDSRLAFRTNGLSAARRLQVYRNNVFASLTGALRACYPVINRLVGERFFDLAAKHYIRYYPSSSGNLHELGRESAGFIRAFPRPQISFIYSMSHGSNGPTRKSFTRRSPAPPGGIWILIVGGQAPRDHQGSSAPRQFRLGG